MQNCALRDPLGHTIKLNYNRGKYSKVFRNYFVSALSSDFRQTPHPRLECNAVSSGIKLTGNWAFIFNLGENMYKIRWRNLGIYFGEKWKSNPYLKLINNKHSRSSELLNLYLQHFLTSAKAKWNNLSFVNYIFLTPDLHLSAAAKSQT